MTTPDSHADSSRPAGDATDQPAPCPAFVPRALRHQLRIDGAIRWMIAAATAVCIVATATVGPTGSSTWMTVVLFGVIGLWFVVGTISTRVTRQIPQITSLIERNEHAGEPLLARALQRRPLPRSVRLLLYHRLAMLRQRQHRYAEVAAICQTVLSENIGGRRARDQRSAPSPGSAAVFDPRSAVGSGQVRRHLLFMLVDAQLQCRNLWGAYVALIELHRCRMSLLELMQLVLIQTRYETAAGHAAAALKQIGQKVCLAELMPATQCGAMHALLATAAERANRPALCQWLVRRAELLGGPRHPHAVNWTTASFTGAGEDL